MAKDQKKPKKEYVAPKIREWGSVTDLTQAITGDSLGGTNGGGTAA